MPEQRLDGAAFGDAEPKKQQRINGSAFCLASAALLLVAGLIAWSLLTNSDVAADFDSGTHSAHTGGIGVLAFLCAVPGAATALAAMVRGPLPARLVGLALLATALPLVPICGFVALLSVNS
jgi:hypothetical protein